MSNTIAHTSFVLSFRDFKEITKAGLSISVVFSSVAGYLLGADKIQIGVLLLLAFGGYFMVGASNVFNQIIERRLDAIMKRTKNRPIPSGRISLNKAFFIGLIFTVLGIVTLYFINPKTVIFAVLSIGIYIIFYTPLKTYTPLSVFVGAFPGAIPFMLGWVAATNDFGIEAGTLFMIQFFWQFPHFWAIAWLLDDDYRKAGFKMLPTGKKDRSTVIQIIMYILWMMLTAIFPVTGLTGALTLSIVGSILVTFLGGVMLYFAIVLYRELTTKAARNLMLSGVFYISFIQIIYVLDKWIQIWI